jgi:hypothetical protein
MLVLYSCSTIAARKKVGKLKYYYIVPSHGNDVVAPDKHDLELYKNGAITAKGFALNYEVKLRSQDAYEWMSRVSREATHEDVVLVEEDVAGAEKSCRIMLAEMMASMFGGQMNFRYKGELE